MDSSTRASGKDVPSQQHQRAGLSGKSATVAQQPVGQATVQRALYAPDTLTPAAVMALQSSVGNQAVLQMLRDRGQPRKPDTPVSTRPSGGSTIQPKLAVGPVGDKYEQEADRVARQVMSTPAPSDAVVQRKAAVQRDLPQSNEKRGGHSDSTPVKLRFPRVSKPKAKGGDKERGVIGRKPLVQRASKDRQGGFEVNSNFEGGLQRSKGGGAPLPNALRVDFEPKFGADFGGVKVHTDAHADRLNRSIQAKAFTSGQDLFFRQGAYNPRHREGQELIAHELTHVMQQNGQAVQAKRSASVTHPAEGTGASDVQRTPSDPAMAESPASEQASSVPTFLKAPNSGSGKAPIQRRFGFEIEIPMLFLSKQDFPDVPVRATPPNPVPTTARTDVPSDAANERGETEVFTIPGADAHINVDHNGSLDPLFKAELEKYALDNHLTVPETAGLLNYRGKLIPHQASILEVVTDAWDENALDPTEALAKFDAVKDYIDDLFDQIHGDNQLTVGNFTFGSETQHADYFQPKTGYFHATYGVKLSQVPRLFQQTTSEKDNLKEYAKTNPGEKKHADNVERTFHSLGKAQTALKKIKKVWPRTGEGWFKSGHLHTKGTKNWNPNTQQSFLGFLTLIDNYLLAFNSGNTDNLAKQQVGMHYYKSDLHDVAQQLPNEIIDTLGNDDNLRGEVIAAIAKSVGMAPAQNLTGPMAGWTLEQYLEQIFTGQFGKLGDKKRKIRDPLLSGSINPYSKKLGPEPMGPGGSQEMGVVMENRHLEYMDQNYGQLHSTNQARLNQEYTQYHGQANPHEKAMFDSRLARETGPGKVPIDQWVPLMMNIYNMLIALNQ